MQQQSRLQKSEIARQDVEVANANLVRNISIGAILGFLVVITLLVMRYRQKQKTTALLESQKNEINAKNASLERLLEEKDWLVKEVHHRVKNNLQMVMSLLNAQSHYLQDEKASSAIRDSQHRIHSMSLIHKKLYQSDNVTTINTEVYINELIEYFRQSFNISQRITFRTEIEAIELDASQAVPIGLILNEAITNSVKHAFPDGSGTISIYLMLLQHDKIRLQVSDDGTGMQNENSAAKTLGMRLMNGLSEDLDGIFTLDGQNGVSITLEFKLLQPVSKN